MSLGRKYASDLGEWVKSRFGINPAEVISDFVELKNGINDIGEKHHKALSLYYTQIDKIQDLLSDALADSKKRIVVLIDELDRCDPGEAFDVIKQLRILFSIQQLPIVFVLSANPEPIGLAIRHQYGLVSDVSDYESRRIMEKFVDTYVDMSAPLSLGKYTHSLWVSPGRSAEGICFVHDVDKSNLSSPIHANSQMNANIFSAIGTDNYLYNNLRVLAKSYEYIRTYRPEKSLKWTVWHLEILEQMHASLRREVRILADEIACIAANSLVNTLRQLVKSGVVSPDTGTIHDGFVFQTEKGNTAFSIYRSWFWDAARYQLEILERMRLKELQKTETKLKATFLSNWLTDRYIIDFVVQLSLVRFRDGEYLEFVRTYHPENGYRYLENWRAIHIFPHLAWLLSNY